jgi:glutathione synthase
MGLKVAIQMDPIGGINIAADSTFRIMEEAQARGHALFYYTPDRLSFRMGRILARGWPVTVRRVEGRPLHAGRGGGDRPCHAGRRLAAAGPALRHGLHHDDASPRAPDAGDARRERPVLGAQLAREASCPAVSRADPDTLIARDLAALRAFKAEHGDVILKPLYGNGGAGVFRLDPNDRNLASLHELFTGLSREPLIAQQFLPDVAKGDKRIILVDGEPVGAINRVPARARRGRTCMWAGGPRPWGSPRGTGRSARGSGRC